jgi:parallel beta-helix repeat protein
VSSIIGRKVIWSVAAIALLLTSSLSLLTQIAPYSPPAPQRAEIVSYTSHAPISIVGDGGFLLANTSTGISKGSGTQADPYIIKGWSINASGSDSGISVSGTSKFLLIADCILSYAMSEGILLSDASNVTVTASSCFGNQYGIRLSHSENNHIVDSMFQSNANSGIYLLASDFNNLSSNNCTANRCGIYISSSGNNTLFGNDCGSNSFYGVALLASTNNSMIQNSCSDNKYGIDLRVSASNILFNNTCNANAIYGIALMSSDENNLTNNTCFHDQFGIDIHLSDNNSIVNNACSNDMYGIWIGYSSRNTVLNNTCSIDQYGIHLIMSDNNTVLENLCLSNAITGLSLESSSNNTCAANICTGNLYGIDLVRLRYSVVNETDYYFSKVGSTYYVKDNATNLTSQSTDARALIQGVIDSLTIEDSARLYFDNSTYIIKTSGKHENTYYPAITWELGINVSKRVSIICNGTTFKAQDNLPNQFTVFYLYDTNYIEVRGAHIDCNQRAQGSENWVIGIFARRADWSLIENCEVWDFGGYAIFIDNNCSFPTVRYNYVHDSANMFYSHGIAYHNNGDEGLIFGNRVDGIGNSRYAIFVDSINDVRVIDNMVGDADGFGIVVSDGSRDTLVMGNWVTRTRGFPCMLISDSNDTQVIGNHVFGNMSSSIYKGQIKIVNNSLRTVVKGNYMHDSAILNYANDSTVFDNHGYDFGIGAVSYTVGFDGANYTARNQLGIVEFSESNFSALMESVISSAPVGSRIVFEQGSYIIEKAGFDPASGRCYGILIGKGLQFEGRGATFVMADSINQNYAMIIATGADGVKIEGIAFDVNADGQMANEPRYDGCGVWVVNSSNPLIQKCDFYDYNSEVMFINGTSSTPKALDAYPHDNKIFSRNTVYGIYLSYSCKDNNFFRNNCSDNTGYGVNIPESNSTGNRFCNNTFYRNNCSSDVFEIRNSQASDRGSENWWNTTGLPFNYGNFWSDYSGKDEYHGIYQNLTGSDNIGDTPYLIGGPAASEDFYPLMIPVAPMLNLVPPITIPDPTGDFRVSGWYVSPIRIPSLDVSGLIDYGIFHMYYSFDGRVLIDYDASIIISANGAHTLEFYVVDIAGNIIHVKSIIFKIDLQAPVPEITLKGKLSPSVWYLTNVTFEMMVYDSVSGVNRTNYRVDGGDWQIADWSETYITFNLTDGIHAIEYFTEDNASNIGLAKSLTVKVDTLSPVLDILSPTGTIDDSNVTVAWNANDSISGISRYEVVVDSEPAMDVGGSMNSIIISLPDGMHTIIVRAIDVAGNVEEHQTIFTVEDKATPPDTPHDMPILLFVIVIAGLAMLFLMVIRGSRSKQKKQ